MKHGDIVVLKKGSAYFINGDLHNNYFIILNKTKDKIKDGDQVCLQHLLSNKFIDQNEKLTYEQYYQTIYKKHINTMKVIWMCSQDFLIGCMAKRFPKTDNGIFKDKRVVIVGPAPYLEGGNRGHEIDSYDIVVRINSGYKLTENCKDYGSRTDVLYHVVNQHPENGGTINMQIIQTNNIKNVIGCYPCLSTIEKSSFTNIGTLRDYITLKINNFSTIVKSEYIIFEKQINTRPNAGTVAIFDLLKKDIKSLYIIGFTLFKDGYSKNYRETDPIERMKKAGHHNQEKIADYYRTILDDERVIIDPELSDLL